jgi:hypothetical protein
MKPEQNSLRAFSLGRCNFNRISVDTEKVAQIQWFTLKGCGLLNRESLCVRSAHRVFKMPRGTRKTAVCSWCGFPPGSQPFCQNVENSILSEMA